MSIMMNYDDVKLCRRIRVT